MSIALAVVITTGNLLPLGFAAQGAQLAPSYVVVEKVGGGCSLVKHVKSWFFGCSLVGRAGFEPATVRFLRVSLVGWVIPTVGRHLQHLRQPMIVLSWLGSSARLSYRPVYDHNRKLETDILALVKRL